VSSVIGFPRIGEKRELKFALEKYWAKEISFSEVEKVASELKIRHWNYQKDAGIEFISSNDFSYYDQMLDMIVLFGAIPNRFSDISDKYEQYFAMARGNANGVAMGMSKWFNTNYHYIIPELHQNQTFKLNSQKIVDEYNEAKSIGVKTKINLIGIVTFLALSTTTDNSEPFIHFEKLLELYCELFMELSNLDDEIYIQIEEPLFAKDCSSELLKFLENAYLKLSLISPKIKIIFTTYFEHSNEATKVMLNLPIYGIGLDFVAGVLNWSSLDMIGNSNKVLFAGVVNGRNIWKNDIEESLNLLNRVSFYIPKKRVVISSSCSLLHSPYSLKYEENMSCEIKEWLSFALEKLQEIVIISKLFFAKSLTQEEQDYLDKNKKALESKKNSEKVYNKIVRNRVSNIDKFEREMDFKSRLKLQREVLNYPNLATTTIGSFPQTKELRNIRKDYKNSQIGKIYYENYIKSYIDNAIKIQEDIGLDILVHGEPERNDMVEYFGELLEGFVFSQNGWVQSYGARCVKPPILYGDVSRNEPMTVKWITYAQSKTNKIVKGMLTGPVTIINWSFVRDDIPKSDVAYQIALALSDEIDDLQKNGIKTIQVDEAAFKEGYPLRIDKIRDYENWAVMSFKLSVSSAYPHTQIHTHMCYSDFSDIMSAIDAMDADVITIETAKSGNKLLKTFKEFNYQKEIGLGVYDIHSPRVPTVEELEKQIKLLLDILPKEQLWINPDCGLKTRKWEEVIPSLTNMVKATKNFR